MHPKWFDISTDEWIRHITEIHFHPEEGAPYWLKFQKERGIDALREIRRADDLIKLGPMDEKELARIPVEEFIPKRFMKDKSRILTAETGGTTGVVKNTAYSIEEFRYAFSDFFHKVASGRNFPGNLNWLFVAPSGPHIIYRSAIEMAKIIWSNVTLLQLIFDPRWVKKIEPRFTPLLNDTRRIFWSRRLE